MCFKSLGSQISRLVRNCHQSVRTKIQKRDLSSEYGVQELVTPNLWLAQVSGSFLCKWGATDVRACLGDMH